MVACGCGKNPAGQDHGRPSAQRVEEVPIQTNDPATNQAPDETSSDGRNAALYQYPGYAAADIVVHNGSTNEYWFKFDSAFDANIPVKIYLPDETATNANKTWEYWTNITIYLGNGKTGEFHIVNVPTAGVNPQLFSGQYHRVLFQVLDPGDVKVTCE